MRLSQKKNLKKKIVVRVTKVESSTIPKKKTGGKGPHIICRRERGGGFERPADLVSTCEYYLQKSLAPSLAINRRNEKEIGGCPNLWKKSALLLIPD